MRSCFAALLLLASLPVLSSSDRQITGDVTPDGMFPPSMTELVIEVDGDRMSGFLYQANGKGPHPTVLLLHGLPGNEKNLDIAQAARAEGFNVLFFHYRGAWGSEGTYRLTRLAEDVAAALGYLRNNTTRYRVDAGKLSLLGHSMGGHAALAAGSRDPAIACIGAMAPANLGLIAEGIRSSEPDAMYFLEYADSLFMLEGFDGKSMRDDLLGQSPLALDTRQFGPGLRGKNVLMVVGEDDVVTPEATAFTPTVMAYQRDPAIGLETATIPGDHAFSWSRGTLTRLVVDWLKRECR